MIRDLHHGVRTLRQSPVFSGVAIVTLAIGIGLNAALFSVVQAVFLRPLPYPDADRLLFISAAFPGFPRGGGNFSYPDFEAMTASLGSFESLGAYQSWGGVALTGAGDPARLSPTFVTPAYLRLAGARAAIGRTFEERETIQPGGEALVVISDGLWRDRFAGDPAIVGRQLHLNGEPFTVIGVMARGFRDLGELEHERVDVWLPLATAPGLTGMPPLTNVYRILWGIGRLRDGVSIDQARDELGALAARLEAERPQTHRGFGLTAIPLDAQLRGSLRQPSVLLVIGAVCVLVIGAANVATLVLVRLSRRRREIAVRTALGASRWRIARQLAAECACLAVPGAVIGMAVAVLGVRALAAWSAINAGPFVQIELDAIGLLSPLAFMSVALLIAGLTPVVEGATVRPREMLAARGADSRGASRRRRAFVMAQIALALTLLTGAALTARSFWRLTTSGLGFDTTRLVTFRIDLTADRFANVERRGAVTRAMLDRFREVPGVTDAMLWGPSMLGRATWVTYLIPEGRPDDGAESSAMISMHAISPGALQALGIPMRRGRELEWSDDLDAPRVAVVSESVARALWPNGDAVGKRVRRRGNPAAPWVTVVGVAADARHRVRLSALDAAQGMPPSGLGPQYDIYFASVQRHETSLVFGVRVADAADPTGVVAALRSALAGIDGGLPLHDVSMLDERIARQEAPLRALAIVAVAYAVIALLLASLGVYGVLAESVAQRVQEIGVRIALGAGQVRVLRTVLTSGGVMLAWGMALGLAGGQIVAQAARSLLYGIDPADAGTIGTAIVLLAAAVFAAALVPAIRASRIDPIAALRADP